MQPTAVVVNRRAFPTMNPVRVVRQGRGADVDEAPLVQAVEAPRRVERRALVVPVPGLAQRAPERVGPAARAPEQLGPPPRLDPQREHRVVQTRRARRALPGAAPS